MALFFSVTLLPEAQRALARSLLRLPPNNLAFVKQISTFSFKLPLSKSIWEREGSTEVCISHNVFWICGWRFHCRGTTSMDTL